MNKSSKIEYVVYRLNLAKETLEAAKSLVKYNHWNSASTGFTILAFMLFRHYSINTISLPNHILE